MELQHQQAKTLCPYCARPISSYSGRMECPHCGRAVFSVPCPKCSRPTLNLTLISRYGKVTCFACQHALDQLPEAEPTIVPPMPKPAPPSSETPETKPTPSVITRTPKNPIMPSAEEARAVVEKCMVGLERAATDREMLRAPDLRAIINRYLDTLQAMLDLDTAMLNAEITDERLREASYLDAVAELCFTPLWPEEGALLPPSVQAWVLVVDDAARRWQYARRRWLADTCGLTMMPTVPAITTTNRAWHEIHGDGPVVKTIERAGFLLHGEVLRKAIVCA